MRHDLQGDIPDTISQDPSVIGRYRVTGKLGEGGFATVYSAHHVDVTTLQVALKLLKTEFVRRSDLVARFKAEAATIAALQSPHTVRLSDFGLTADGSPFMVMEYITGGTLDDLLRARRHLSPAEVARFALGVLRSLEEAHEAGIIHRDVKPANVMLAKVRGHEHPIPKLTDFGIAKSLTGAVLRSGAPVTVDGSTFCTPQYAAPEVLEGNPTPASDLYAVGIMMIELLDGELPYDGDQPVLVAARHLSPEPVPLGWRSELSGLGPVIERAVAKHTTRRFQSAEEMIDAIDAVLPHLADVAADETAARAADGRVPRPTAPNQPVSTAQLAARRRTSTSAMALAFATLAIFSAAMFVTWAVTSGEDPRAATSDRTSPPAKRGGASLDAVPPEAGTAHMEQEAAAPEELEGSVGPPAPAERGSVAEMAADILSAAQRPPRNPPASLGSGPRETARADVPSGTTSRRRREPGGAIPSTPAAASPGDSSILSEGAVLSSGAVPEPSARPPAAEDGTRSAMGVTVAGSPAAAMPAAEPEPDATPEAPARDGRATDRPLQSRSPVPR